MFRSVFLQLAALAAAMGHADESVLLQTKSMVFEHVDKQATTTVATEVTITLNHLPDFCLTNDGGTVILINCIEPPSANQKWILPPQNQGRITFGGSDLCLTSQGVGYSPTVSSCSGSASSNEWVLDSTTTLIKIGNNCLHKYAAETANHGLDEMIVYGCWTQNGQPRERQEWTWTAVGEVALQDDSAAPEDGTVEVTGDPHMRNLNGEVFDLSREGEHVLIQVPAGSGEKLEVIGTVTAFHKKRKCPTFFLTQLKMKGSMVGEEVIQIVSDPETFGVKLGAAKEFMNIDLTKSTAAGIAQVQRCNEDNVLCRSTSPGRRTPNYANKLLVQLPSAITIVASNYASANPSFMNLAVSGLTAQGDVGGLLGNDDHSMIVGEPGCETSSGVHKISMLQRDTFTTVGHLRL
jgi:hypothetical protein